MDFMYLTNSDAYSEFLTNGYKNLDLFLNIQYINSKSVQPLESSTFGAKSKI